MPPVAARTRQRWRARLLSSAAVVLQALAESASVGTEALLVLGQCSTRAGLVDALARSGAVSWSRRLAELAGWLARALGVERPLWGGVTVTQRFGSDLRLNPHFHTATPDGVFALNATGDSVEFVRVPAPSTEDISAIVGRVHRYAVRLLSRRGLFADDGEAPLAEPVVSPDDAALGQCYGGALTGRAAFGPTAGRPSGRLGRLLRSTPPQELGPRCARSHGFNLHARAKRDGAKRSRDGSWRRSGRPRAALPLPDAPPNLARAARAPR